MYAACILCIYSLHTGIYITHMDFKFWFLLCPKALLVNKINSAVNSLIWLYCLWAAFFISFHSLSFDRYI